MFWGCQLEQPWWTQPCCVVYCAIALLTYIYISIMYMHHCELLQPALIAQCCCVYTYSLACMHIYICNAQVLLWVVNALQNPHRRSSLKAWCKSSVLCVITKRWGDIIAAGKSVCASAHSKWWTWSDKVDGSESCPKFVIEANSLKEGTRPRKPKVWLWIFRMWIGPCIVLGGLANGSSGKFCCLTRTVQQCHMCWRWSCNVVGSGSADISIL